MSQSLSLSTNVAVIAAGNSLGTATALGQVNFAEISSGTGGVRFSNALGGNMIMVKNDTKVSINVYPISGGSIDALGASNPYVLLGGQSQQFVSADGVAYYSTVTGNSSAYLQQVVGVTAAETARTLTVAQSGSLVSVIAPLAALTISLPAIQSGLNYKVKLATDLLTYTVTVAAPSAILYGFSESGNTGAAPNTGAAASTNAIFAATCKAGDYLDIQSDASKYYVEAHSLTGHLITYS